MAAQTKPLKPGMRGGKGKPGMGSSKNYKPGMTRLRTVWITEPSASSFKDDYALLKQIGEPGQFGKAYQCKRKADGKILAVKEISKARIYRLHPSDNIRQSLLKSMQAEIDIMRRLKHKYIVNMFGTYETKHTLHIVMEECKGGELFDRIKAKRRYPEAEAKPIVRMVCEALFYMHDQHRVVHCDLKPDNILFVDESEKSDIKIIDFGMAVVLKRLKSLRALCGTPYYTAPEVIRGDYSHEADMWSIGVIAYVMIFAMPPFYVSPSKFYGAKETKEIYKLIIKGFTPEVKEGYGPWFPRKRSERLGAKGMDFIGKLLVLDKANRMTAKEALQHAWLNPKGRSKTKASEAEAAESEEKEAAEKPQVNALQVNEFAKFADGSEFKYAVTALFRDQFQKMRPQHFEQLRDLFTSMDEDNNGKISYDEFRVGMAKSELQLDEAKIKQMFAGLDARNLGEIEFNDLLSAAVHDYLVSSDARLYEAFRDLDDAESGKIKTSQLKAKIQELMPYGADHNEMLLKIIDDVSPDNDGTIDYEAFLQALHPDFSDTPNWFWSDDKYHIKPQPTDYSSSEDSSDDGKVPDVEPVPTQIPKPQNIDAQGSQGSQDIQIVKEGYLRKQGGFVKTWRLRWFEMQNNGVVSYYHNANEDYPIARFNCREMQSIKRKSWSKSDDKKYGIKMYTPHRDWKFLAKNEMERTEWMQAIQGLQKQLSVMKQPSAAE